MSVARSRPTVASDYRVVPTVLQRGWPVSTLASFVVERAAPAHCRHDRQVADVPRWGRPSGRPSARRGQNPFTDLHRTTAQVADVPVVTSASGANATD